MDNHRYINEMLLAFFETIPSDDLDGIVSQFVFARKRQYPSCLLYTSDAADERYSVDLGGRRIIKKKFFQAEDGIRDPRESRGLGDVYKRQIKHIGFYCYGCRGCVINDYGHLWCTLLLLSLIHI